MNASRPLSGNGCKQTGHPASGRFCLFQCAVIKYDCKRQQELERPRTEPSLLTAVVDTFAEEEDWSSARPAIKLIQQSTRAYAKYGQHDDYAEKGGEISHACEYARLQEGRGARSRESRHTTPVKCWSASARRQIYLAVSGAQTSWGVSSKHIAATHTQPAYATWAAVH